MNNINTFSNTKPEPNKLGDLLFANNQLFIAKRKGSRLVWKKRAQPESICLIQMLKIHSQHHRCL